MEATPDTIDEAPTQELLIIHENPSAAVVPRKRPRNLTACDKCRLRKVKCDPVPHSRKCEACQLGNLECSFKDRTRRQVESITGLVDPDSISSHPGRHLRRPTSPVHSGRSHSVGGSVSSLTSSLKRPRRERQPSTPSTTSSKIAPVSPAGFTPPTERVMSPLSQPSDSPVSHSAPVISFITPTNSQRILDPANPLRPRADLLPDLIQNFDIHFSCFFPFWSAETHGANSKYDTPLIMLGVAALSSRFLQSLETLNEGRHHHHDGYLQVAHNIIRESGWGVNDSIISVQSLVILAWAEFGSRRTHTSDLRNDWCQQCLEEAVRIARRLGLGRADALSKLDVPAPEALNTWWSLLLIDEMIAWAQDKAPLLRDADFDHQIPSLTSQSPNDLPNTFAQVVHLSHVRRHVGCTIFDPTESSQASAESSKALLAAASAYNTSVGAWPDLCFGHDQFHNTLRIGQGEATLYSTFHAIHYSVIFRFAPDLKPALEPEQQLLIKSARNLLQLATWAQRVQNPTIFLCNVFMQRYVHDAGQAFINTQASHSDKSVFEADIQNCSIILSQMSRHWRAPWNRNDPWAKPNPQGPAFGYQPGPGYPTHVSPTQSTWHPTTPYAQTHPQPYHTTPSWSSYPYVASTPRSPSQELNAPPYQYQYFQPTASSSTSTNPYHSQHIQNTQSQQSQPQGYPPQYPYQYSQQPHKQYPQ